MCLLFIYINAISYYNLFAYFNLCLSVMCGSPSCSFTYHFLLNIVPILGVISETKYMICWYVIDREFESDNVIILYDSITNLSEIKWKIYLMICFTPIISFKWTYYINCIIISNVLMFCYVTNIPKENNNFYQNQWYLVSSAIFSLSVNDTKYLMQHKQLLQLYNILFFIIRIADEP